MDCDAGRVRAKPIVVCSRSLALPRRIASILLWSIALLVFIAPLEACGEAMPHGSPAWQRECAAQGAKGCPCHQDHQCQTLWCVNSECAERESL
jgi:hypothetical protein